MRRSALLEIIDDVGHGVTPDLLPEDFPCLDACVSDNPHITPDVATRIAEGLGRVDIPTFERAVRAIDEGELAWIGFKVVFDAGAAQANVDNQVTKKYGEVGSADGSDLAFFVSDAKEIVASRPYSARDAFQMKDVTRGPSMHNDQFDGLTWVSVPLFDPVRVWLLGASDAASEVARLAHHVGFAVEVVDDDPAYVNEERFPSAKRHLIGDFSELGDLKGSSDDYACVLTRGHMHDHESCVWASAQGMRYVGMMGCKGKNERIHDLCIASGMTEGQWAAVKRPIGLKFGAKSPAEPAIAIVAELVDVRYRQRYDAQARARHEQSLGR